MRPFIAQLLPEKQSKVQSHLREKALPTTSFRSLGEVSCLPSVQSRPDVPEQQGDRAPDVPLCSGSPPPAPAKQGAVHLRGFLLGCLLCSAWGWAQSQRVALRSQPQGPRLAPEDVYFVSWSLRRPLMVLAVVRVGEIGPAPCSQLTYPSASGH